MSQIETRRNLVSIDSISEIYSNVTTFSESILEIFENTKIGLKNNSLANNLRLNSSKVKYSKNSTIESPYSIATKFKELYSIYSNITNCINLEAIKTKVIQSIVEMPLYTSEPAKIKENIVSLFNSDKSNIKSSVNNLICEVQKQHTSVFANELKRIVSRASEEAGFRSIHTRTNELSQVIVALDKVGKGIVTEIKIDEKSKQIDLISETVGIIDGSCTEILRHFDNSLKRYGVKFSSIESKITNGSCQNTPTKKVDKTIKQNKEKEKKLKQVRHNSNNIKLKQY